MASLPSHYRIFTISLPENSFFNINKLSSSCESTLATLLPQQQPKRLFFEFHQYVAIYIGSSLLAWCCRGTEDLGPQYFRVGIRSGSGASSPRNGAVPSLGLNTASSPGIVNAPTRRVAGTLSLGIAEGLKHGAAGVPSPGTFGAAPPGIDTAYSLGDIGSLPSGSIGASARSEVAGTQSPGAARTSLRAIAGAS